MPINPLSSSDLEGDDNNKDKKYSLISGSPVNVSGFESGQTAQQTKGSPTSSGSFTNLQSYLDQNSDQSGGLGAKIEDNIQGTVNEGRTDLSKASNEFNNQIDQAGINRNQASSDALYNIVQKAYNDPTKLNDADYGMYSDVQGKKNTFEGAAPKDINSNATYQNAVTNFGTASDKANLTGSEAGRETLLRDTFNRPSYTKGQSSLDQLLTQNVPENRNRFEKLRTGLLGDTGLVSEENKAIQAANEKRTAAGQDVASANQDIQDYLFNPNKKQGTSEYQQLVDPRLMGFPEGDPRAKTALMFTPQPDANGNIYQTVQGNKYGVLSNAEQQAQQLVDQLKARQSANYQNVLNQAGNMGNTQQTLGADLTSAISKSSNFDPNLANSLTPQEFARIQALNKLAGRDPGTIGDQNISLASERFDPKVNLDQGKAGQLIQEKANQFKADMGNELNQYNAAPVSGYRFGNNMPLPNAADDIVNRVMDSNPRPDVDVPEADKVINTYNSQVSQANNVRAKYNLPALSVNDFYDGGSKQASVTDLAKKYLSGIRAPWGASMYQDPNKLNQAVNQLVNNPGGGGNWPGISPEVLQNLQQVAQIKALANLMSTNKDQMADPTKKLGAGTNTSGAGRTFFD